MTTAPLAELARRVAELERRLASAIRLGTVLAVDPDAARVTVRYGSEAATAPIPWVAAAAGETRAWRAPSEGEQVVLLCPGGELALAIALPGVYRDKFRAPEADPATQSVEYSDGAVVAYDPEAHELSALLPDGATLRIAAPGGATAECDLNIDGNLAVDGDISATGDISGANVSATGDVRDSLGSLAEMRAVFNGHTHLIPGPPPTVVPAPVQKMT